MSKTGIDPKIDANELETMPNSTIKAAHYAVIGLLTDGAHHKQWALEQVLESLGIDLNDLQDDVGLE